MRNAKMLLNDAFSYATVLFTNHKKNWGPHSIVKLNKVRIFKTGPRGLRMIRQRRVDAICGWLYISFVISHTYLISAFIADNGFLNKGTEKVSLDCEWKTLNPRWRLRARWKHQELKPNNITLYWTLRPQTRFDMHQVRSGTTLQNRLHLPS